MNHSHFPSCDRSITCDGSGLICESVSGRGTYQTMVWILINIFLLSVGIDAIIRDGDHKQTICDNAKVN